MVSGATWRSTYPEELPLVGRRPQPADVLEREPADADGLDGRQVRVVGGLAGGVLAVDRRQRVDGQTDRRHDDERDRDDRHHLPRHAASAALTSRSHPSQIWVPRSDKKLIRR